MSRVEIFRGQARRRWSDEAKRRLVAETLVPGATVHAVAQRHGVNTSQLFTWRKRFRTESGLPTAVPVAPAFAAIEVAPVLEARAETGEAAPHSDAMMAGGVIEIELPKGRRVRISGRVEATGVTDMRRGMNSLALQVQEGLGRDPHAGDLFVFRGRKGHLVKILWHDGLGFSLYAKRLERGRFLWPSATDGVVAITPAQLGYMLEGIDWRNPQRTWRPLAAG